jgi:two-component system, OmpR family, response regulator
MSSHRRSTGWVVKLSTDAGQRTTSDLRVRVLVVDDEPNITELVSLGLRYEGFDVASARDGRGALRAVGEFQPAVIVLDIGLPDIDGLEVCRRMRADGTDIPVIFLTARDATEDKVAGLTIGGDDYLTKPFSLDELIARIRAIARRGSPLPQESSGRLQLADLVLDENTHEVYRGERSVALTPTEFRLLRYLLLNPGRVLSKAQILDHVWHYGEIRLREGDPLIVIGDELRLRQVVGNLIANAQIHTPPNTRVDVEVGSREDHAILTVSDRGPGIDPEQAPHVFERFFRASSSDARGDASQSSGSGLGLAIVAAIMDSHGGTATLRPTQPEGGATFEISLPLAAAGVLLGDDSDPTRGRPASSVASQGR